MVQIKSELVLSELSEKNNGVLKIKDLTDLGVPKSSIYYFLKKYNYEKVGSGIYISKDAWLDRMKILQKRLKNAIFSHDTALFLFNMTDVAPSTYSMTVINGYNTRHLKNDPIRIFRTSKHLFDLGITEIETPFGNKVKVYNVERTICDLLRNRNKLDIRFIQEGLKNFIRTKNIDYRLLEEYSRKFRVSKILNTYLEILL